MMRVVEAALLGLVTQGLSACAAELEPRSFDPQDAGARSEDAGPGWSETGHFRHREESDVVHTVVDATSYDELRFLDLDTGLADDDPSTWDLAFQRMAVSMNGGVTGGGGVEALVLEEGSFDSLTHAPLGGYSAPLPDGDDRDSYDDNVFTGDHDEPGNAWYEYTVEGHVLTPRPWVYVVRSTEGRAYKLAFDGYYDEAGSPAHVRFRWAEVPFEAPN